MGDLGVGIHVARFFGVEFFGIWVWGVWSRQVPSIVVWAGSVLRLKLRRWSVARSQVRGGTSGGGRE